MATIDLRKLAEEKGTEIPPDSEIKFNTLYVTRISFTTRRPLQSFDVVDIADACLRKFIDEIQKEYPALLFYKGRSWIDIKDHRLYQNNDGSWDFYISYVIEKPPDYPPETQGLFPLVIRSLALLVQAAVIAAIGITITIGGVFVYEIVTAGRPAIRHIVENIPTTLFIGGSTAILAYIAPKRYRLPITLGGIVATYLATKRKPGGEQGGE